MKPWWSAAASEPCGRRPAPLEERHGPGCDCLRLLSLVGGNQRSLRFGFCLRVLQRHWRLTCEHGEPASSPAAAQASGRWCDLGEIDGVKAILLKNA